MTAKKKKFLDLKPLTGWDRVKYRLSSSYWKHWWWEHAGNFKWWWQKKTIGYSDDEVFDFFHGHAKWVLPRLEALRDSVQGWPDKNSNREDGFETFEEWTEAIDKMIFAFEFILDEHKYIEMGYPEDYEHGFYEVERKEDGSVVIEAIDERMPDTTAYDEALKKHEEGMQLFAAYYRHLWN